MTPQQITIALDRYKTLNEFARLLDDAGLDIIFYHSHMILNALANANLADVNAELDELRDRILGYPANFACESAAAKYDSIAAEVRTWQHIDDN